MSAPPQALTLRFNQIGRGNPVIILHGLFGWKRNWGAISKALSARHHVFALDLRNHGESPWSEDMSYDAMAEDIARFIRSHAGGGADIIGHSMGGKVAMTTALKHGNLVNRLCVVDIAPVPSPGNFATHARAMLSAPLRTAKSRGDIESHIASAVADPSVRAFLMQNIAKLERGFRWRPNVAVIERAMDDIMRFPASPRGASHSGPTLFIAGGDSDYIQPRHHGAIKALFPKARIDVIPGAGHWVHTEKSAAFISKALDFLT